MVVNLVSFGYKNGVPVDADLVFDVRCLPNPHFVETLRERTGLEAPIVEFLAALPGYEELLSRLSDLLLFLLPRYRNENRSYLTIGIGCTGGRHRSVAVAERLGELLRADGWSVDVRHRDLERRTA